MLIDILQSFCLLLLVVHRDKWMCSRGCRLCPIWENGIYMYNLNYMNFTFTMYSLFTNRKLEPLFFQSVLKGFDISHFLSHNIIFQKANVDMLWLIMFACSRLELYTELLMDWVLKNLQVETVTNLTFVEWIMLQNFMPWQLYVDPEMTVEVDFIHDCQLHTFYKSIQELWL